MKPIAVRPVTARHLRTVLALLALLNLQAPLRADSVTLKSGAVLTGEIVNEDAYELTLKVSRTADGGIQTLKVIDQAHVERLQRDTPAVAIEPDPGATATLSAPAEDATPPPSLEAWREAIRRADALTAEGRYDEAIARFRRVMEQAEYADAAGATNHASAATRLETLQLREEAGRHLVISLRGKLDFKEEAINAAETSAAKLERRIGDDRAALQDLENEDPNRTPARRLGDSIADNDAATRRRDLQERITLDQNRLRTHQRWAREETLALVNLQSEIKIAETGARQATTDYNTALRQSRSRR